MTTSHPMRGSRLTAPHPLCFMIMYCTMSRQRSRPRYAVRTCCASTLRPVSILIHCGSLISGNEPYATDVPEHSCPISSTGEKNSKLVLDLHSRRKNRTQRLGFQEHLLRCIATVNHHEIAMHYSRPRRSNTTRTTTHRRQCLSLPSSLQSPCPLRTCRSTADLHSRCQHRRRSNSSPAPERCLGLSVSSLVEPKFSN